MRSSTTGQYGSWAEVAGFQSSSPASWRSPSASSDASNGVSSSSIQPAANGAASANQPQFGSMMATLLQTQGITDGATGSGVSDDVQFAADGSGAPLLASLQSLLSILSDRDAASTAGNSASASSTSTVSAAVGDRNDLSSGSAGQTSLPPWAAGWFNVGASTEAATTGWSDPFGQQNGTVLNQQYVQAASVYAVTGNTSNASPLTSVTGHKGAYP